MGVVGLTSLVEENDQLLLNKVELRNCRVIVDGHSLVHSLYFHEKVDFRFGGDYSKFQSVCEAFLDQLQLCQIDILVVFDGSLNIDDKKLNTTVSRQKSRLQVAKELSHGRRGQLLPLFATNVFTRLLNRRGKKFVQCVGDADSVIASLSNHFGAPVISLDSDFFIFDLSAGYLPFDSFEWKTVTVGGSIRARLYVVANLLSFFPGIKRECLPLFACVMGNDFVRSNHFGTFFMSLKLPEKSKRLRVNEKHRRMLGFLAWLEDKTVDEAVDLILSHIKKENRDKVAQVITANLGTYKCQLDFPEGIELTEFSNVVKVLAQLDQMKSEWLWPDEMFSDYLEGFYPPSFCYIRGLGKYFLPTLVEDFSQPSAYKCAGNLRKVAYQLLEEFLPGEPQEKSIVNEYFRDGSHLVKVPVLFRPNYISEAKIEYRSDSFRVAECQELFYAALGIAPIQQDDVKYDDRIFLAATIYWVKHAEPKVKGAELAALLINRCRADANESANQLKSQFDRSPDFLAKRRLKLRVEVLHSFCQWQAVYQAVGWLNCCLRCPFPEKNIGRLYSGRFIYNLSVELLDSTSLSGKLNELMPSDSPLRDLYHEKLKPIRDAVGPEVIDSLMSPPARKSFKQKRRLAANFNLVDKENLESKEGITEVTRQTKSSFVDAENKFALLSLLDG